MPLRPGDRFGRYELSALLGTGGMGEVYSAYDTLLHRRVALKILRPAADGTIDGPASTEGDARLLREARAAARLTHPNAVSIYDVGEVDGVAFLAMELIAGRTLRTHVGDPAVPLPRRIGWLVDVARALGAAHQLGLVHRDIKPDNIMVGDDGTVRVLDFGLARGQMLQTGRSAPGEALATLTAQGIIVGTPMYMAPEQMRGDPLDGRSDQFSWGVVAYELLTGKRPWEGAGLVLVAQILAEQPASMRQQLPEIPAAVETAIRLTMKKLRDERFKTMEEVADALAPYALAAGEGIDSSEGPGSMPASNPIAFAPTERVVKGAALATKKGSRGRVAGVAAVVGLAVVIGGVEASRLTSAGHAEPASPDSGTVADAPSQMSPNAEATAAYKAGAQAFHNAALGAAFKQLNRAIELDPLFAAAHVRRALLNVLLDRASLSEFKEDLQQARNSRASLGEHDRLILDAFEPWAQAPPDLAESQRRLEAAGKGRPSDAEFPFALGLVLDAAEQPVPRAIEATLKLAIARDPSFAVAWKAIGPERLAVDDVPGALEAYAECLKVSPGATSCLGDLTALQANQGRCEELVGTSRRLISLAPDSPGTYLALADGLLGDGQPIEAVRVALGQERDREPPEVGRLYQIEEEASLAILRGDFAGAESQYAERERLSASAPDDESHAAGAYEWMLLDLEVGRPARAANRAENYLHRRSAWSVGNVDWSIAAYVVELEAGRIGSATFNALRDRWLARNQGLPGPRWVQAYARAVETPEDAAAALAAQPDLRPLIQALWRTPRSNEPIGRTYLLAGRLEEAIRYLSEASASCFSLSTSIEAIPAVRAALELGEAFEARGDRASACSAYGRVLLRWGTAVPASRTSSEARRRRQSLGCPP